jgi:hypothetical protein
LLSKRKKRAEDKGSGERLVVIWKKTFSLWSMSKDDLELLTSYFSLCVHSVNENATSIVPIHPPSVDLKTRVLLHYQLIDPYPQYHGWILSTTVLLVVCVQTEEAGPE